MYNCAKIICVSTCLNFARSLAISLIPDAAHRSTVLEPELSAVDFALRKFFLELRSGFLGCLKLRVNRTAGDEHMKSDEINWIGLLL